MEPAGFRTHGFAHAETVYAGSDDTPSLAHGNSHADSHDSACYQVTSNHQEGLAEDVTVLDSLESWAFPCDAPSKAAFLRTRAALLLPLRRLGSRFVRILPSRFGCDPHRPPSPYLGGLFYGGVGCADLSWVPSQHGR
jgi:hypothetical protein